MSIANLDLRQIARVLGGEISNGQVLAPGPGHSAADRSMSVKLDPGAPDGFVVHSFADDDPLVCRDFIREKCGAAAVAKPNGGKRPRASREDIAALFAAAVRQEREDSRPRSKPVATFDYAGKDGALLYQVLKYEHPKTFRQRRPDGSGGWVWKLEDRRVLYRLPELLQYPDGTVFVTEGEKDADRVASLNLCTTTVASGTWRGVDVEPLAGRDIIILQDNDAAGAKRALEAARQLHGKAKTLRVVLLPDLAEGGDVSNWLDADSRRAEKLVNICFAAPEWTPPANELINEQEPPPCSPSPSSPPQPSSSLPSPQPSPPSQSSQAPQTTGEAEKQAKKPEAEPLPPLPWIDMSNWDNEPVPQQEWAVLDRIPLRQCALFTGEGSAGKSTVELHRSAAHTLGRDWLGSLPEQGPAIFVDAEDDAKVLHRRLAAICRHYGVAFADLIKGGLHLMSLADKDAVLATVSRNGKVEPTPLYQQLLQAAADIKPKSITIASSANVFTGDENIRTHVQQFMALLTRMAVVADGSTVLIAHPSLTGINTDTGLSGSTAWHNAVRARFYMKGIKAEPGEQPDDDLREIVFKKNQYGPKAETVVVRYTGGMFLPVPGATSLDKAAHEAKAKEVFLSLLRRFETQGRHVSDKPSANNYAPKVFAAETEAKAAVVRTAALQEAMRTLFEERKIHVADYGSPSRGTQKIATGSGRDIP
jgi:RecA-family ATPase